MPIVDLQKISSLKDGKQRVLGLDVGEKTIGLALSDTLWTIATPMETIRRSKFSKDILRLESIIQDEKVGVLIIGLPINMNGTEGPRCQSTRQFAENVNQYIDIPIVFWDERLSTSAVTRTLIEADVSRKKRAQVVDKMAASFILQGALDAMKY